MCDHDEEAEKHRDELVARARLENGAAWNAAVCDATARAKMIEAAALLLSVEKLAMKKRGLSNA